MSPVPGSPTDINLTTRLPSWTVSFQSHTPEPVPQRTKGHCWSFAAPATWGQRGRAFRELAGSPPAKATGLGLRMLHLLGCPSRQRAASLMPWGGSGGGQWTKTSPLSPLILELTPTLKHFRGQSAGFSPQVTAARGSRMKRSAPVYIDRLVPLLPAAAGARL